MTKVDLLTILLSSSSFLLSVLTLYLNYFHKKISLIGQLVTCYYEDPSKPLDIELEFALSNIGNQEILIREICIDSLINQDYDGLVPILKSKQIPAIIRPGKSLLLKIDMPSYFMNELASEKYILKLDFHFISNGKQYILHKTIIPNEVNLFDDTAWTPFRDMAIA